MKGSISNEVRCIGEEILFDEKFDDIRDDEGNKLVDISYAIENLEVVARQLGKIAERDDNNELRELASRMRLDLGM